jgi:hypothetical protein
MPITISLAGYGSLINPRSRALSGRTGTALPVRLKGYQRAWNAPSPGSAMTAVGVVPDPEASCNAVLVEVADDAALAGMDEREIGYRREAVLPEAVSPIGPGGAPTGAMFIYVPLVPTPLTEELPLLQSYCDVILTGCLEEFGAAFAEEFCRSTAGWDGPWLNDRVNPRYVRAMSAVPLAAQIDEILERCVPAFARRR